MTISLDLPRYSKSTKLIRDDIEIKWALKNIKWSKWVDQNGFYIIIFKIIYK